MPSPAGLHNPQLRSRLLLAAVPLAALAVALFLAFVLTAVPQPEANSTVAQRVAVDASAAQSPAGGADGERGKLAAGAAGSNQAPLWTLLTPWAFDIDAIAVLGLAAVLLVRYVTRRRRGART